MANSLDIVEIPQDSEEQEVPPGASVRIADGRAPLPGAV